MGEKMVMSREFVWKVIHLIEAIDKWDKAKILSCRDEVFNELSVKMDSIKARQEWQEKNKTR